MDLPIVYSTDSFCYQNKNEFPMNYLDSIKISKLDAYYENKLSEFYLLFDKIKYFETKYNCYSDETITSKSSDNYENIRLHEIYSMDKKDDMISICGKYRNIDGKDETVIHDSEIVHGTVLFESDSSCKQGTDKEILDFYKNLDKTFLPITNLLSDILHIIYSYVLERPSLTVKYEKIAESVIEEHPLIPSWKTAKITWYDTNETEYTDPIWIKYKNLTLLQIQDALDIYL